MPSLTPITATTFRSLFLSPRIRSRRRPETNPAAPTSRRVFLLLFALLTGFYLATSSGHVSSSDEDITYYMTEGFVERGSFAMVAPHARALAVLQWGRPAAGSGGGLETQYGVLQPLLTVPFYLVGKLLALLAPPEYGPTIERLAATGLSAVATAAAAVALAATARLLGYSLRVCVGLGLIYGVASLAWPYARTFWSEPVIAALSGGALYLAVRARSASPLLSWAGVAFLLGAAFATRTTAAIIVPAFAAYLLVCGVAAARGTGSWRWLGLAASGFGLGIVLPSLLFFVSNLSRFGNLLEEGHGLSAGPIAAALAWLQSGDLRVGLEGMLLSPGRGLLFYTPLCLLLVVAIPKFAARHRAEALLALGSVASLLFVYGSIPFWSGDPSWGPRYIVRVLPFLFLPLASWIAAAARPAAQWATLGLVSLTVAVQLFGGLIAHQVYIAATDYWPGEVHRYWTFADSPILGHARMFAGRVMQYTPLPLAHPQYPSRGEAGEMVFLEGLSGSSGGPAGSISREEARIRLATDREAPAALWAVVSNAPGSQPWPNIALDGRPVSQTDWRNSSDGDQHWLVAPLGVLSPGLHTVALAAAPIEADPPPDSPPARLVIRDLAVYQEGLPFGLKRWPEVRPLPVSQDEPWSRAAYGWFNSGRVPHLADWWPWYAAYSGLPGWLAWLVLIPIGVVAMAAHKLARLLALPSDRSIFGALAGLVAASFFAIMLLALVVPATAARPFYVAEPTSAPGTWALHPNEGRLLPVNEAGSLQLEVEYFDLGGSPIVIHFRASDRSPWEYARWALHRDNTQTWRHETLVLPPAGGAGRRIAFATTSYAILRPLAIGDVE